MARKMTGTVVSNSMDKTASVAVDRVKMHPVYRKRYKATNKYLVHDESNECEVGDTVIIEETRPASRRKRWTIHEITEKAADKGKVA